MRAPHNVESLRKIRAQIMESCERLERLAAEMESLGVKEVRPNYHKEMLRGISGIDDFTISVAKFVREESMDRGAFQAAAVPAKKTRSTSRGAKTRRRGK